jgi:hypothetical protein
MWLTWHLRLSSGLSLAIDDSDLLSTEGGQDEPIEPLVISSAIITKQAQSLFLAHEEASFSFAISILSI